MSKISRVATFVCFSYFNLCGWILFMMYDLGKIYQEIIKFTTFIWICLAIGSVLYWIVWNIHNDIKEGVL